jgi:hypothetical protein
MGPLRMMNLIDTGSYCWQKKTCVNRFSMDRWDFKECKKFAHLIIFGQNNFGKYGRKTNLKAAIYKNVINNNIWFYGSISII